MTICTIIRIELGICRRIIEMNRLEKAVTSDRAIDITSANNGAINISAHGTGDVVVNAGTKKVAVVGDVTTGHTHAFALTAGPYPVAGTITSATDTISTAAGSPRFKG